MRPHSAGLRLNAGDQNVKCLDATPPLPPLTRVSESEAILEREDRKGLRLLASTLKDVVAVGRDSYGLGGRDDGQNRCDVNLAFLQSYEPVLPPG
jgi:hypothetical protein